MAITINFGGKPTLIAPPLPEVAQQMDPPEPFDDLPEWRQKLRVMLPMLTAHGVKKVKVSFSGSGDSGEVDGAEIDDDYDHPLLKQHFTVMGDTTTWKGEELGFVTEEGLVDKTIAEIMDDVANAYADETGVDWYNNDGGFGSVELDLSEDPPVLRTEINQYETVSECIQSEELAA